LLCLFDKDAVPELADPIGKLKVKSSSARLAQCSLQFNAKENA